MSQSHFAKKVYEACSLIPKGKVSTYKLIAENLDCKAYRAVGTALHNNPYALVVPCHRVVNSDGRLGGFNDGASKKIKLLRQQGVEVDQKQLKIIHFDKYLFKFQKS